MCHIKSLRSRALTFHFDKDQSTVALGQIRCGQPVSFLLPSLLCYIQWSSPLSSTWMAKILWPGKGYRISWKRTLGLGFLFYPFSPMSVVLRSMHCPPSASLPPPSSCAPQRCSSRWSATCLKHTVLLLFVFCPGIFIRKREGICNTKHPVSELILKTTLKRSHFTEEETEAPMDPSNRISGLCGQPELSFESKTVSRSKASGSVFGFSIHLGLFLIYLTDACEFQLCTKGSAMRREIQGRLWMTEAVFLGQSELEIIIIFLKKHNKV